MSVNKEYSGATEEMMCDRVSDWCREYFETFGMRIHEMKLSMINRRWGKQLRRFGFSTREVLERDARFGFRMEASGGVIVSVRIEMDRSAAEEVRAQFRRDLKRAESLMNGGAFGKGLGVEAGAEAIRDYMVERGHKAPGGAPPEPEVSEDVRRLAELMSDPEA